MKKNMTFAEALAELGISRPALYRRIAAGYLTPLSKTNLARQREPVQFSRDEIERLKIAPPVLRPGRPRKLVKD